MIKDRLGNQIKVGTIVFFPDKYELMEGEVVAIRRSTFVKVRPIGYPEFIELPYYPENLIVKVDTTREKEIK